MLKKTILITGGAGFIGSNFAPYFAKKYPKYRIINLDKLTYAGNPANLAELKGSKNYAFVKGDICNAELIAKLFKKHDVRGVIHFAAESHVDNSITGPLPFIKTNIEGTFILLDAAKKHWMEGPFKYKKGYEGCRLHHISTDEVYGTLGPRGLFKETTPYAPNSPYSASKASSDFLVRAYHHTFGLNVTTSNCSNNYGPKQHGEKLIPTIIRKALSGQPIPIYGDGKNVRDWLYVLDHCKGIDLVYHKGKPGQTYNIGGRNERNNLEIVSVICKILDGLKPLPDNRHYKDLITFVKDRPGHDKRYAIDAAKLERELGWRAAETFDTGILKTVKWYLKNGR
ncbi:MAG: dTDP-glucose 4,6-dehydratase [Elusimicrobiota bacterium]|jgi:dTDP-glucose 4,6-dehydratase|nr:dTDP-glucose 4,6-dehydratase [Elusimicrobiota bacterium]